LAAELARVAVGTSTVAPSTRDRRFADPAWTQNPLLRRAVRAYLVAAGTAGQLVGDAHLDWRDDQRMRLLVENLVEAAAPSNVPLVKPGVGRSNAHASQERVADRRRTAGPTGPPCRCATPAQVVDIARR
jgi:polyhydroxyalkanoate synthase